MRGKLLLVAMLVACGGGHKAVEKPDSEATAPLTPEAVVTAAKGVVEQYRQAYEVRSMDALAALYSRTVDVVLIHQGEIWHGWTDVQSHLEQLLNQSQEIHIKVADVSVVALGPEGATVSAQVEREVSDSVTTVKESGLLTMALRLEGDRWVIVTEHFSYRPGV